MKKVTILSRLALVVERLVVLLELRKRARVAQHLTARRRANNQEVRFHKIGGRPATWNENKNVLESSRVDEANAEANSETWRRRTATRARKIG